MSDHRNTPQAIARDSSGKLIGARAANGKPPADLSPLIGRRSGSRVIVGVSDHARSDGSQLLDVRCACGVVVLYLAARVVPVVPKCKACGGSGVRRVPKPRARVVADAEKQRAEWRAKARNDECKRPSGDLGPTEVCGCAYYDGRLVRRCGRCAK